MISVTIDSIRVDLENHHHVVVLKEESEEHYLPIWIGPTEANAIAMKLQGAEVHRPLSHDLICSVIEDLGAKVDSIVITELRSNTFYAEIILKVDGEELQVDSRPSDALALAVRTHSSIYVEESILDEVGIWFDKETGMPISGNERSREASQEELRRMSVFTDFINTLDLDDINKDE
jgi:bifunctional DNase/RNase